MKRVIVIALGASAVAALAAGCGSSGTTAAPASSSPPASSSAPATSSSPAPSSPATGAGGGAATLKVTSSSLGQILTDGSGRTLYLFKADTGTSSTCNGTCALAWPPDTTTGQPNASGVSAAMVGTTMRADHATEVTFNGHPLYYFAEDAKAGDTKGQGVTAFGGTWYVVSPSGNAITGSAPAPAPTAPAPATSKSSGGYGY